MKKKKRINILKIVIIILVSILILFILNYVRINLRYFSNKTKFEESFLVYGNTNGYVPQGLTYSDKYDVVLQTSYSTNKASKIFIIDFSNEQLLKEITLLNKDGTNNTKHVGGIATDNNKVWISNDYEVDIYDLKELLKTNTDKVKPIEEIKLPIRGDFCYFDDNTLWIGEFYLKPQYDVKDGKPKLYGYRISDKINYNKPDIEKILPKAVQSMVILPNGDFAFGRSYTYLVNSYLSIYNDIPKMTELNKKSNIKLPPMIEGMFIKDDYIYMLFESSADKYSPADPKLDRIIKYDINNIK